jgi:HAD superfamily hydrolase (TIGR01549 family)
MPEPRATLEVVFLDIGGVMYDDTIYARSFQRALRELGAAFTDEEFDEEYRAIRAAQSGSFRKHLSRRFLPDRSLDEIKDRASTYWAYPPEALFPDVRPCLELLGARYRLGVIANQPSHVREAMARDGLDGFFEVWGVSDDVGLEKPDPRLFTYAAREAGLAPSRAVMVGDRLDYDVRPAASAGMRTVWMLRGEAPDDPTAEQLAEADAAVSGLAELPSVLESW